MNYTEKYHLPQWDETDRIMRADFNQMCADMENGLLKTARDAAEAVSGASTGAASAAEAARRAQSSADSAMEKASAAQEITLGFQPYFLIVWMGASTDTSAGTTFLTITQGTINDHFLKITKTGFTLRENSSNTGLNISGGRYYYLAFR